MSRHGTKSADDALAAARAREARASEKRAIGALADATVGQTHALSALPVVIFIVGLVLGWLGGHWRALNPWWCA